jgi:hypothetical protein
MSNLIDQLRACRPQAIFAVPQSELDFRWVLVILVGAWVAISFFLAGGGWSALAAEYRSDAPRLGKPLRCSMVMGQWPWSAYYRGIVHVRLGSNGMTLSVSPFLRLFHPPLFIPWNDISEYMREPIWFTSCTSIRLRESRMIRMRFLGQAGKTIFEAYSQTADVVRSGTQ